MHRWDPTERWRRALAPTLAAVGCAALLVACGSSKSNSSSAGGPRFADAVKFSECMRSHGVSNFPDPGSGGGIQLPAGANPQSPAFRAAQKACMDLMPGPGGSLGHGSEARKLQLLHLAECMRRHGILSFPDPSANPPSGPPAGGGIAFGAPGAFLSVPQAMIQSPGFQQAATACGFPGAGRHQAAQMTPVPS